jgi:hypothetical protein
LSVGARHQKAVEPEAPELAAQLGNSRATLRALARIVE